MIIFPFKGSSVKSALKNKKSLNNEHKKAQTVMKLLGIYMCTRFKNLIKLLITLTCEVEENKESLRKDLNYIW